MHITEKVSFNLEIAAHSNSNTQMMITKNGTYRY